MADELSEPITETTVPSDSEDFTSSDDDDELDESSWANLTGADRLRAMITAERERNRKKRQQLEQQRASIVTAKSSIATLIGQITDYKILLENEKGQLEGEGDIRQITAKEEEIERERAITASLQSDIAEAQKEKQHIILLISEVETKHEEAIESEIQRRNEMKQETVANLQLVMHELQRIEEANELLRLQHEKLKRQIEEENNECEETKRLLSTQQDVTAKANAELETLRVTNEALLTQLASIPRMSSPANNRLRSTSGRPVSSTGFPVRMREDDTRSYCSMDDMKTSGGMTESTSISPRGTPITRSRMNSMASRSSVPGFSVCKKLEEHTAAVTHLLSVGGQMWSGCADGNIRIWEIETGQMLEDRRHHSGMISDLLLVKDKVWSSSVDKTVLIWSPKKALPEKKIIVSSKDKDLWVNCMMEADQFVWLGCNDGIIRLYDSKSLKPKKDLKMEGTPSPITCFIKNSNTMWCGTSSGLIHIWNCTTLKTIKTLQGHTGPVHSFTSIGPASYSFEIWSCSGDATIRCWSSDHHDNIKTMSCRVAAISLTQAKTSHHVWAGAEDGKLDIWDAKTYDVAQDLPESEVSREHESSVNCLLFVEKTNEIWSGSSDCFVLHFLCLICTGGTLLMQYKEDEENSYDTMASCVVAHQGTSIAHACLPFELGRDQKEVMPGVFLSDFRGQPKPSAPPIKGAFQVPQSPEEAYFRLKEVENSLEHLVRSNELLVEASLTDSDEIILESIDENKRVIEGKLLTVKLLNAWLEKWKEQHEHKPPAPAESQEKEKEEEGIYL
ncbi:hypothetical protein PROFUN_01983 [Planoprotostelium fungivorum]|uniref:Uncharacterized protein n=1 Tax=Planoprotostelium fungivorum TaxID=1890364 RepID=A0A2P6NB35_9EUKA|nr:hypothetical protein PROFUN_01983 [Planoprotostelium fungivorum]